VKKAEHRGLGNLPVFFAKQRNLIGRRLRIAANPAAKEAIQELARQLCRRERLDHRLDFGRLN
jgi:hypothetical protein